MNIELLKYPVGKYTRPEIYNPEIINTWTRSITDFPDRLVELTRDLDQEALNWRYRPDGWTIKQVVHHCADSHMNSFIRFKLALTEESPTIKPYFENLWAELPDGRLNDISPSLQLLKGLHHRWSALLQNLSADDLEREMTHPEYDYKIILKQNISLYAWHCDHHLGHIRQALEHKGAFNE